MASGAGVVALGSTCLLVTWRIPAEGLLERTCPSYQSRNQGSSGSPSAVSRTRSGSNPGSMSRKGGERNPAKSVGVAGACLVTGRVAADSVALFLAVGRSDPPHPSLVTGRVVPCDTSIARPDGAFQSIPMPGVKTRVLPSDGTVAGRRWADEGGGPTSLGEGAGDRTPAGMGTASALFRAEDTMSAGFGTRVMLSR